MRIPLFLLLLAGCSTSPSYHAEAVRGQRYCEVFLGKLDSGGVHIDIYNSFGLGDCPEDQWSALSAGQLKVDLMVDAVRLNGPRYWLMDALTDTPLVSPAPMTFGEIPMREIATAELTAADAATTNLPYVAHAISRATTWRFDAGATVYELSDPMGAVYAMQSYSVQQEPQTESSLAGLGSRLTLPSGWSWRSRVLDAELSVTVTDEATVVQDDFLNTYQRL